MSARMHSLSVVHLVLVLLVITFGCRPEASNYHPWAEVTDSTSVRKIVVSPTLCTDCIRIEEVAVIGDTTGPGDLYSNTMGFRDRAGYYWIGQGGSIKLFDSDGKFQREVGRSGEGPLEFRFAQPIYQGSTGNIHIMDLRYPRLTVVTPEFALDRTIHLPAIPQYAAILPDGRYVMNMNVPTTKGIGQPLHIMDKSGEVVHSFGAPQQESAFSITGVAMRRIVTTDEVSRVFTVRPNLYLIEVWTPDGRRIVGYEGGALNPYDERPSDPLSRENPPDNRIFGIHVDGAGLLWIASLHTRNDWYERSEEITLQSGRVVLEPVDGDQAAWFLGRIDVIDLDLGEIVARSEHNEQVLTFLGDNIAIGPMQTESGDPQLGVWRVSYINDN